MKRPGIVETPDGDEIAVRQYMKPVDQRGPPVGGRRFGSPLPRFDEGTPGRARLALAVVTASATSAAPREQLLDKTGKPVGDLPDYDADWLRGLYRWMTMVRCVDQRMLKLQRAGRIGFVGSMLGMEAAMIGSAAGAAGSGLALVRAARGRRCADAWGCLCPSTWRRCTAIRTTPRRVVRCAIISSTRGRTTRRGPA